MTYLLIFIHLLEAVFKMLTKTATSTNLVRFAHNWNDGHEVKLLAL